MGAHYPFKRKFYRTTIWKNTGIRRKDGFLLLARARGMEPIRIPFCMAGTVQEVRLVYEVKQQRYAWHFVVEEGSTPVPIEKGASAAIDMGEIHPVAITDGEEVCIVSCRALRSVAQQTNKELAEIARKRSRCQKGSRRFKRLNRARTCLRARQKRRRRDLEHKISRATLDWCREKGVDTLYVGDVREVADKTKVEKRLGRETRQKVSNWPHGAIRRYLGYKAEAAGISVHDRVPEAYTSQTCIVCGTRHKPKGRVYRCSTCGLIFPRDGVGAANILSRALHGELGKVRPTYCKYRRPFQRYRNGLRSPADTRQVANAS
jgi:putative transposase